MRLPLFLIAVGAFAQNSPHIRDWKPDLSETPAAPKSACAALYRLTGYDFSVMTAEALGGDATVPPFCRVLILVQPEIRIEVSLPTAWNRRLYMFGNGGYAGENLEAQGRVAHRNAALKLGFAVTQTNTGHDAEQEPLAVFALNQQKLVDFAFRSLHVTAETAKRVAEAYYGSRPARSYFNGCSTGGRQGLILAQRFPDDFDGIIVGAPVLDYAPHRLRAIAIYQALSKGPIPAAKLALLAERVYARCDGTDGLNDGLITDPRRCDFKPARDVPVCAGEEREDCFTPQQIRTLETIYGDVILNGERVAPGFPVGAEIAGPNGQSGWDGWMVRDGQLSQAAVFADSSIRHLQFPKAGAPADMASFNLEKDASRFDWLGKLANATDPDLRRFRDRGGKILMYFGWADPAVNAVKGAEYYEQVLKEMGPAARDFFRLYMMPGVFHCSGGVGPACFDPLANIVPWVERGQAPEAIVASQIDGGKTVRTRPLCPYPQVAKYRGEGNVDEAANFRCAGPD
ncbi:MAG: tannase/feruloyl esterase family alpha/beta hydrolase [Bryobacteraceae bacterium]|nr:tannase/feruloyl esterase family alpha/beta hydrolase [Bryobacteraceae bacterium]